MRTAISAALCLIALASAAQAQGAGGSDASPTTRRICVSVAAAAPPPADLPTAAQAAALAGCDAEALYYGIGRPPDPAQARLCAFAQRGTKADDGSGFSGNVMLMTIYANGIGARRDLRLATHFACRIGGAPAEVDGRVADLAAKAAAHWTGHDFSWCEDVTSGLAGGFCAAHDQRIAAAKRQAVLDAYAARLHGAASARFAQLRHAQAAWAQARGGNEIDLSGTLRGAFVVEEEELQDRDFLDMIERLGAGRPPPLGTAQLRAATVRMNAILARIAAAGPALMGDWGTVTKQGIADTQSVWAGYRDAWGAFAAVAYPAWGSAAAAAWVTMKRADMLAAFLKS